MRDHVVRSRDAAKARRIRAARPVLEGLEGRVLLYATTGDRFQYGSLITYSIMPDGTNLGGTTSNLQSTLNSQVGQGVWVTAIEDAFAEWENYANVNFVPFSDNGAPFNSGNIQQGSSSFGDIRIGGFAQASNVLAFCMLPPPNNGGSAAGDIFINTAQTWHIGSNFDFETVMFHEIGHALGLGHSADPNAAMYATYEGVEQGPDQDDVNGVESIWGPRQEDAIASKYANFTSSAAYNLTNYINPSNNQIVLPSQDVANSAESYWFKFTTPANTNSTLTVTIQTTGLSELSPRIQLYNSALQGLVQAATSPTTYGTIFGILINNATPNTVYYVRVLGSSSLDTGTGAYALTINMGNQGVAYTGPPYTLVYATASQSGTGMLETAGGANNPSNTPYDTPDQVSVGSLTAQGDFLMVPTTKLKGKHRPTHINVPHPLHTLKIKLKPATKDVIKPGHAVA